MGARQLQPVLPQERIAILDVLRGIAICGILVGNLQWFSGYGFMPPALATQSPIADQITHFLVHFLIEGKFYSLFSFLFGFGFGLQIDRAEARGDTKGWVFKRRLFWLLVIGLLHAYFLWYGDILSVYAVVGMLLILFRKTATGVLLKWAWALILFPIFTYILLFALFVVLAPPDVAVVVDTARASMWSDALEGVPNSGYMQILTGYNLNNIVGRYMGLIFEMRLPKILAMFLIGFYAYRRGFLQDPSRPQPLIGHVLIYGLTAGIFANFIFAAFAGAEAVMPPSAIGVLGVVSYAFGVPAMTLGLIALVVTIWQKPSYQSLLAFLAPVGRMALTNYLLQTVICVFLFYGYGLGQFGKIGAARATLLAFAIFLFQVIISWLWLKYFIYGPMEWIWRQLTYGKRISLGRKPAENSLH